LKRFPGIGDPGAEKILLFIHSYPVMALDSNGTRVLCRVGFSEEQKRALAALQRMDASDQEINFRTVAAEAGVSTAWLYGQERLRGRIMRSRRTMTDAAPPASVSRDRERASRQNRVATLRLRIKTLEEKNRELAGLLELAYGELALAREGTFPWEAHLEAIRRNYSSPTESRLDK
jgi:hypothetical protein